MDCCSGIIQTMRIREEDSGLFLGCRVLTLSEASRRVASVHFVPRGILRPAELTYVTVDRGHRRQGYGTQAMQVFIDRVGHGKVVTTQIVHSESWGSIRELGLLRKAFTSRTSKITSPDVLSQIPITNFLQQSGMDVARLVLVYGKDKKAPTYDAVMEKIDREDVYLSFFRSKIEGSV